MRRITSEEFVKDALFCSSFIYVTVASMTISRPTLEVAKNAAEMQNGILLSGPPSRFPLKRVSAWQEYELSNPTGDRRILVGMISDYLGLSQSQEPG